MAVLSITGVAAAQTLYVATGTNCSTTGIYRVNGTDASSTFIGQVLLAGTPLPITGLAVHPTTGVLYGVTAGCSTPRLVTINKTTGVATLVGTMTSTVGDITFASDGTLYGWIPEPTASLTRIDIATGAQTNIGPSGLAESRGIGLGFAGGTLYLTAKLQTPTPVLLRTVNPATGSVTAGIPITGNPYAEEGAAFNALAGDAGGRLLAVNTNRLNPSSSALLQIDTATGVATTRGVLPNGIDALAVDVPLVQFSSSSYSIAENGGSATLTVTRTGDTTGTSSVNYSTSNASATAPGDYTASSGTVNFTAGSSSQTFPVPITNDLAFESTETFTATLASPSGALLGTPSSATVSIIDDDPLIDLSITKTALESDNAITFTIRVTNSGSANATGVTVTDPINPILSVASAASTQGTCTGTSTVTCNVGTMIPGATVTITIRVTGDTESMVTNTATVTFDQTDPNPANNVASVTANIPALSPLVLGALAMVLAGIAAMKLR